MNVVNLPVEKTSKTAGVISALESAIERIKSGEHCKVLVLLMDATDNVGYQAGNITRNEMLGACEVFKHMMLADLREHK